MRGGSGSRLQLLACLADAGMPVLVVSCNPRQSEMCFCHSAEKALRSANHAYPITGQRPGIGDEPVAQRNRGVATAALSAACQCAWSLAEGGMHRPDWRRGSPLSNQVRCCVSLRERVGAIPCVGAGGEWCFYTRCGHCACPAEVFAPVGRWEGPVQPLAMWLGPSTYQQTNKLTN